MRKTWKKRNEEGVSPVIATILMVAITVVLAAVLYVMVMNLGDIGEIKDPLGLNQQFKTSTSVSLLVSSAPSGALVHSTAVSILRSGVPTEIGNVTVFTPSGAPMAWYSGGAWAYAGDFDADTARFQQGAAVVIVAAEISNGDVITISSDGNYFMPTQHSVS